ncbi:hypothetical protein H310_04930 [Aphanomyces invadans]|uniref:Uncharacterized protein n=1 Tax=Aphanomyces invadans TaxID=157072 RepID=A0A024UB40_9STRA|nr:hypothetical protein H310_04930 [Aphanomyces invadans]ETW03479.1 hypothetical protein H310_04930 [Aphanomyces invadans]|eukprot:XP_008867708.1 hypothetical protein H310_04930 [Aphanomyces invadans]
MAGQCVSNVNHPTHQNVLDLGFFRAIQSLQQTHHSITYQEIVDATNQAWEDKDTWSLERNFFTLQCCLREVIMRAGENSYKIPHIKKVGLSGRVPESISCGQGVFDTGCVLLSQQDLVAVMRDLAIQTRADLEMSDILTALETVDLDKESVGDA